MTDKRIVFTTAASHEQAKTLANALVTRRLAACVNILGPMESVYRWKGDVENEQEFLFIIKSTENQFPALRAAIRELHSYEIPECVEIAIENGTPEYLEWIGESVTGL